MKKTLLFAFLLVTTLGHTQNFWTAKATAFTQISRGLDDISIVDANTIWAKAYDGASTTPANVRQFTRSINGGENWTAGSINLGANQTLLNVSSISAVSATTAWVTAYSDNPATVFGGVWKTTDSGATWVKQTTASFNTGSESFTNLVYFWDANTGICQGDPASGYFEIYITSNGGTNWTRIPSANIPAPLTGEYGYVHDYDVVGSTIWFGTNKGRVFKSVDQGVTWTVAQSPITDFAGATVSGKYTFSDLNNGLLVSNSNLLYQTTDGGATWLPKTFSGSLGTRDLEYVPGTNTVISVGDTAGPTPTSFTSYSTDNGSTWTTVMSGTQVTTLKFLNDTTGFGGGFTVSSTSGGVFKYTGTVLSTDSWESGRKLTVYPNPAQDFLSVNGEGIASVAVYDLLGKQVMRQLSNGAAMNNLDVSGLAAGMYVLRVTDANGMVQTEKFLKK